MPVVWLAAIPGTIASEGPSMITIARFSMPLEAQIARSSLEAAGIPAFVADEHTINLNWMYSDAMGGVRLQVPEAYALEAVQLLSTDHSASLEAEQPSLPEQCQKCGSEQLQAIHPGRRMAFLVWLLVNIPLWPIRARQQCLACGARQR